ncbi:MAG: hypothetical protein ACOX9A_03290 [Anaerolineae bacterium]|jgi:hypothetical protein
MRKLVPGLLALCILVGVAACDRAEISFNNLPDLPTVVPTPRPQEVEQPTISPTPDQDTADGAEQGIIDDDHVPTGRIVHLDWNWDWDLGQDDWFEVQIWPDDDDAEPTVFGWFKSTRLSLTRLRLLPGRYRWRVVVVRGRDENRVELSGYSQTGIFVLEQPGVVASTITPDIDDADRATATPTAVRTATATLTRVVVPTRLPPTRVVVPPTAIPSMTPTVPDDPTETVTPEDATETATPEDPAETPTSDDTPTTPTETAVTPDSPMATSTPFPDELPTTTVTQEAYPNP